MQGSVCVEYTCFSPEKERVEICSSSCKSMCQSYIENALVSNFSAIILLFLFVLTKDSVELPNL